jgi:hypothetical protein
MRVRHLQHDRFDVRAREAVLRLPGMPAGQVGRRSLRHRVVDQGEQREVDVKRVGRSACPDSGTRRGGHLARPALQQEIAVGGVLARRKAGEDPQLQRLPASGVRPAERHPVCQILEVSPVEMHLQLVACLRMEAGLGVQAVHVGVDVHHEDGACLAREHIQVVDEQLPAAGGQRRIEVVRHALGPS